MRRALPGLAYSDDRTGALHLRIFTQGYEFLGNFSWQPDTGLMFAATAKALVEDAMIQGREVQITNQANLLVFHARGDEMLYPPGNPEEFWESVS